MICVVIPTFNQVALVSVLLNQLKGLPEFKQLSIVVVDNGSSDGTSVHLEKEFSFVHRICLSQNVGGSGGFIAGVTHAMTLHPEYIWLLDDDAEVKKDTLSELLNAAAQLDRSQTPWGAIGSMMANLNQADRVVEAGAWLDWKSGCFRAHSHRCLIAQVDRSIQPVEYCAAASLLTRPSAIQKVGFFENIFIHYDDVDWCLRLAQAGLPVYCAPASVFWHPTLKNAPVTWVRYYDARNFIWLCLRHNRKAVFRGILHLLGKGVYFYLHRLKGLANLYFLGVFDGLSGRLRLRRELNTETFRGAAEVETWMSNRPLIGVFYSQTQLDEFRKRYPGLCERVHSLFLYEPSHRTGSTSLKTKGCKLNTLIRSCLYMMFHPRHPVVFDGECLHHLMLPPLLNDVCYVFTRHSKAVVKKWGER